MDSGSINSIKHSLNTDAVRRMLIQYFVEKGFTESFDKLLYPAAMQDITTAIPIIDSKIEVIPHAVKVDPMAGTATLGWNLFVLGNHRMYLGETFHRDLGDLARQIQSGFLTMEDTSGSRHQTTPRRVVHFITRVLSKHDDGFVDLGERGYPTNSQARSTSLGQSGMFYGRTGYPS